MLKQKKPLALCAALTFGLLSCGGNTVDCTATPYAAECQTVDPGVSSSSTVVDPGVSSSSSQVINTGFGIMASPLNADGANGLYANWKSTYYITVEDQIASGNDPTFAGSYMASSGLARIMWDASGTCTKTMCTVSEGIGYGMIGSMFANDWDAFNRLWNYDKAFRSGTWNALMNWRIWTFFDQEQGVGFATDADMDVATALAIAYYKTGNEDYHSDVVTIINDLWNYAIVPGTLLIRPGNSYTDTEHNPSYFSPVAFRLFAGLDPTHNWMGALDANYAWLAQVQSAQGLFPEWANDYYQAVKPSSNPTLVNYNRYAAEGLRIPFRLAWDYNWFGDARDAAMLNKMATFITNHTGGDPANIRMWYMYDVDSSAAVAAKVGLASSFCVAGMGDASFQGWVNACNNYMLAQPIGTSNWTYWNHILQMMYTELINGLFTKPSQI